MMKILIIDRFLNALQKEESAMRIKEDQFAEPIIIRILQDVISSGHNAADIM